MSSTAPKTFICATCSGSFPSRNKLYRHLEESGHGVEGTAKPGDGGASSVCVDNAAFEEYYRRQRVCADDAAWAAAYERFQQPLPIAVRCSLSHPAGRFCAALLAQLTRLEPVRWCDGAFIVDLRRTGSGPSTGGAIVLAAAQEIGALHRQEIVSCLPPLLLDAQPEHVIADLCAAPGSKSLQILDALHQGLAPAAVPPGLIVANETERSRLLTMCQRSRRLPRAPFLALCTDARYYPGMRRRVAQNSAAQGWKQKYDRVLADVPCSGDGTLRKNRTQWRKWSVKDGLSLHYLQLKILKRGIELLGSGGTLVYSTCTLNPIEDEAVVAATLEHFGTDFIELQPLPDWMKDQVKPSEGLSEWLVPAPTFEKTAAAAAQAAQAAQAAAPTDGLTEQTTAAPPAPPAAAAPAGDSPDRTMFSAFCDVPQKDQKTGGKGGGMLGRTMFPPPDAAITSQLRLCGRVLPTCVDSGGFFVAVIKRLRGGVPTVFVPPTQPEAEAEAEPEPEPEPEPVRKMPFPSHVLRTPINWPRQARDKHWKS
jgi:16S rRNA C967 or C1407 C5-methylase (RsmB/RsmF family)